MRWILVWVFVLSAAPVMAADDYSNCDVDIGCSEDVADYKDVKVAVIGLPEFKRLFESQESYRIVDVRPKNSFNQRHIKGAMSLFVARAQPTEIKAALPSKDEKIVVYCSNRRCPMSQHAAQLLIFLGYTDVSNYKGGLEEWTRNGLPTGTNAIALPDTPPPGDS